MKEVAEFVAATLRPAAGGTSDAELNALASTVVSEVTSELAAEVAAEVTAEVVAAQGSAPAASA
ncbi:MAG: hypothetical protein QOH86_2035 [Sphingomonadales bacterium]|jgi:hypothetical protein|nr:hypothetical protein [Sphingomonadales bacterium]